MKSKKNSFLDFRNFDRQDLHSLFQEADQLRSFEIPPSWNFKGTAALLFFENSTRTRLSFETACWNTGLGPLLIDSHSGSSLSKGETPEDTILNVAAMNPRVLIIRCGDSVDLEALDLQLDVPLINAGWGVRAHPSQALLDLFTLWKEYPLEGHRLLIVGDIRHSRVASSHFEVFQKMGAEIGACGPDEFKPNKYHSSLTWFDSLEEGLSWCDSVMALRVQFERHSQVQNKIELDSYFQTYGLNRSSLQHLKKTGIILHPGPVNRGVEIAEDVFNDPRCRILNQVTNGVRIRTALLKKVLGCL